MTTTATPELDEEAMHERLDSIEATLADCSQLVRQLADQLGVDLSTDGADR